MDDLRDLYQEVILDHSKRPRNHSIPEGTNHRADGYNPLCGDRLSLGVELDGDVIKSVGFTGSGCAISTASASLLTEVVRGKTRAEAEAIFRRFHALVTGQEPLPGDENVELGKLSVLGGVRDYPVRIKCASLAWHTLTSALADSDETATTE